MAPGQCRRPEEKSRGGRQTQNRDEAAAYNVLKHQIGHGKEGQHDQGDATGAQHAHPGRQAHGCEKHGQQQVPIRQIEGQGDAGGALNQRQRD